MLNGHTAETALDRLLALRPDDLDGWEEALADELPADERAAAEAVDAEFEALLASWVESERAVAPPAITARDILAMDEPLRPTDAVPADEARFVRPRPQRPNQAGLRRLTAALVAALMLVAVGSWIVALKTPGPMTDSMRTKELVTAAAATRLDLQFSVETAGERVRVLPGVDGAAYGPEAHLAMRLDVRGEGGFLTLLEVDASGESRVLYPTGGDALRLDAGSHPLVGSSGAPLVYRPDDGVTGTKRYLGLLTSEPIDAARVAPGVLSAGLDRADLWPRPVLAADAFTVDWK